MTSVLTEDQFLLVEAVRDFARAELPERDAAWDRDESSCCVELDALYDMGIMGLRVPESAGGIGCGMAPYAHIIRELSYASASVGVTVSVHNMVAELIGAHGSADVKAEILPSLAQPGNLAAFAISEPNAGSDPGSAQSKAEETSDGWRLSGSKMWVTNGMTGKWFVVLARESNGELSMFLMDAEQAGVTRQPIHGKMGIRGSETAEMALDGAFVPRNRRMGAAGEGKKVALSTLGGGRISIASQATGIAEAAFDLMVEYSRQREQFGRKIASFQAIQWMIADSHTEIAAARALIDRAARLKDAGQSFTHMASMAKLYASETANRVAYRAVQAHGGYGFVNEFRVEQLYRDARITSIYEGTSEIQRYAIARELLA
ncbi:MAG: acyl-CoA dehydrogenase family protein [Phycisphaerales bacterium]|nr:acyl-CoA dehydrogenase family protein [Phycisphaerales bacterium]